MFLILIAKVVANEEMSSEATNLYTPKYRFERTHVTFPTDYSKWHAEAEKKLKFYNLNSLIKNLQVLYPKMIRENNIFYLCGKYLFFKQINLKFLGNVAVY